MRKEEARQKARLKRARLDAGDVLGLSVGVADNFIAHPALLQGCKMVCSFLPIARQKEVDTWHLLSEIPHLVKGCKIAVPWMQAEDQDFAPCLIGDREHLIAGPFGMPMPAHKDIIHPEDIDLVLVPLLAFDQRGYRVGFGGGYYDRFLKRCRPGVRKVGLDFFGPIAERFEDVWEGDVRLDAVVTPSRVYEFS